MSRSIGLPWPRVRRRHAVDRRKSPRAAVISPLRARASRDGARIAFHAGQADAFRIAIFDLQTNETTYLAPSE